MFRITAVRRFHASPLRFQPPSASVAQLMRAPSTASKGRVAMMPGVSSSPVSKASIVGNGDSPALQMGAIATEETSVSTLSSQEDILDVGTISVQGAGQKVSSVAHSYF